MSGIIKNLRFLTGSTIGNTRWLFPLFHLREDRKKLMSHPQTEICIEGVQRSANSFFLTVFRKWNAQKRISHHLHAAINVRKAVQYGVPCVVLIRHPKQTVASLLIKDERTWTGIALWNYIQFYEQLLNLKTHFVIAQFETATHAPHLIVEELNEKFQVNFKSEPLTEPKKKVLFKNMSHHISSNNKSFEWMTIPDQRKEARKAALLNTITRHTLYPKAIRVYEQFIA